MGTQGKVTDPAATPFATRDGKPIAPTAGAKPTDFTKPPYTSGVPGGAHDFTGDNRAQPDAPVEQGGPMQNAPMLPQQPGTPAQRVNMADAGRGGPGMVDSASVAARGGVQGVTQSPMKFGGSAPAAPRPTSSASESTASRGDHPRREHGTQPVPMPKSMK